MTSTNDKENSTGFLGCQVGSDNQGDNQGCQPGCQVSNRAERTSVAGSGPVAVAVSGYAEVEEAIAEEAVASSDIQTTNKGGGGTDSGYLEPHDKVSGDLASEVAKQCPGYWLLGFCDNGHRFAKELYCGREWCSICGEEWSAAHQRRFARWINKATQIGTMGYFVFTIPEELRAKYRTKKALSRLGHQVQELLKSYGYSRGLRRWHWFGDIARAGLRGKPVFHPHLNCLVDGGYLAPEKLNLIKAAYAGMLGCQVIDVNYRYRRSPGQKVHTLKYVTRATFRDMEWDSDVARQLHGSKVSPGLRNQVCWGRGLWDRELVWSLDDLQGPAREDIEELDSRAIESLESGACPRCGLPITWSKPAMVVILNAVEKRSLGAGYWELPWVRPPPGFSAEVKQRLYLLELLHRVEVKVAQERAEAKAIAEAEKCQGWWYSLLDSRQGLEL